MKKTENISLAGYSFTIEVDAYSELEKYLSDIRTVFTADENAEEIIYDLQGRRVYETQKGKLYIVNNKKVIFK